MRADGTESAVRELHMLLADTTKMRSLRAAAAAAKRHTDEGTEGAVAAAKISDAIDGDETEADVQWRIVRCIALALELLPARATQLASLLNSHLDPRTPSPPLSPLVRTCTPQKS